MHSNRRSSRHQAVRIRQRSRSIHSYDFFNLLTGPEWLDRVDQLLPPHRERLYTPTDTLSLFMAQALEKIGSDWNY